MLSVFAAIKSGRFDKAVSRLSRQMSWCLRVSEVAGSSPSAMRLSWNR